MKKLIAIMMAVLMIASFAACNSNKKPDIEDAVVTDTSIETVTDSKVETSTEVQVSEEEITRIDEISTTEASTLVDESVPSADPAKWSAKEIVEFYKNAAIKSKTKAISTEKKSLDEMVVNEGDGLLGTLVEWVTPFLIKALENSETDFDGITGGYEKLSVSDVASAKSYKSGEYTVVEMTMKEQTDGIHGERYSGTVGHAISVVGDIASVEEALSFLKIDFENADIKLHYSDPILKVKINKDGIIEKGTWSYNIDITASNLHVAAVKFPIEALIESAYGTVGYTITTGGGF